MIVRVLGTAAGGGLPQWNCRCGNCRSAREGNLPARTQASIAVSSNGDRWHLVNATTDVRRQLESLPPPRESGIRMAPVDAILLTDANIDHAGGLLEFRQNTTSRVFSSGVVRDVLAGANPLFAPFECGDRTWTVFDAVPEPVEVRGIDEDLKVTAIDVPGLVPSFAGGTETGGAASAFLIEDIRTKSSLLYAPVFLRANESLLATAKSCDAAFFDGSFWSDSELPALGLGTRTARQMGHAPIGGADGWLSAWSSTDGSPSARWYCTHVNNSNPVLDPLSSESGTLRRAGFCVPDDGLEFTLGHR